MKKIPNINWLHTHPQLEKQLNLDESHVIVDRKDLEEAFYFFSKNHNILLVQQENLYDLNLENKTIKQYTDIGIKREKIIYVDYPNFVWDMENQCLETILTKNSKYISLVALENLPITESVNQSKDGIIICSNTFNNLYRYAYIN